MARNGLSEVSQVTPDPVDAHARILVMSQPGIDGDGGGDVGDDGDIEGEDGSLSDEARHGEGDGDRADEDGSACRNDVGGDD